MSISIQIEGLDQVLKDFSGARLNRHITAAIRGIGEQVRSEIATYPPATEANMPGRGRWYERGYGTRWRTKSGAVHGRKTSEQLGQSWAVEARNMRGSVGTRVSYAPFVQEEERQAGFHKRRGWKTDVDVAEKVERSGAIGRIMERAILHALGE